MSLFPPKIILFTQPIMTNILKIKVLNKELAMPYDNHGPAYPDDAGIDLFVPKSVYVPALAKGFVIPLGIAVELISQSENLSFILVARSSMSKTPIRLSVPIGIIDAGYRGELSVIVDNIINKPYYIAKYTRLAQICSPDLKPIVVQVVDMLSIGSRADKGIGSSGTTGIDTGSDNPTNTADNADSVISTIPNAKL